MGLHPGCVIGAPLTTIIQCSVQSLLASTEGAEIAPGLRQSDQPLQALKELSGLTKRHHKLDLKCHDCLNGRMLNY